MALTASGQIDCNRVSHTVDRFSAPYGVEMNIAGVRVRVQRTQHSEEARTVKMTLIGCPGQGVERQGFVG